AGELRGRPARSRSHDPAGHLRHNESLSAPQEALHEKGPGARAAPGPYSFGPGRSGAPLGRCPPPQVEPSGAPSTRPLRFLLPSNVGPVLALTFEAILSGRARTNTRGGAIMVHKRTATFLSILAALCLLSGGAWAGPQSKCLVSKNKCMAKKVGSLLKCQQKAETPFKP